MDLYLIRHADAAPLGEGGVSDDAERPLTAKGKDQAKLLAHGLQRQEIRPGVVLTSPLVRARQTAEGMLQAWSGPAPELRVCDPLAPGARRRKLAKFLRKVGTDVVAMVGHQPDLGCFAAWLIGSKKAQLDIAKAGVAHIVCEDEPGKGAGTLTWLVSPEWLDNKSA